MKILAGIAVVLGIGIISWAAGIHDPDLPRTVALGSIDSVLGIVVFFVS